MVSRYNCLIYLYTMPIPEVIIYFMTQESQGDKGKQTADLFEQQGPVVRPDPELTMTEFLAGLAAHGIEVGGGSAVPDDD